MKVTKNYLRNVIKECMADMGMMPAQYPVDTVEVDFENASDGEGRMTKANLFKMAKYATQLHNLIQDSDDLEPWVQEKIAIAAEAIKTVSDYMEYENLRENKRRN